MINSKKNFNFQFFDLKNLPNPLYALRYKKGSFQSLMYHKIVQKDKKNYSIKYRIFIQTQTHIVSNRNFED